MVLLRAGLAPLALFALLTGCQTGSDALSPPTAGSPMADLGVGKVPKPTAAVTWNRRATDLLIQRPPASNGQAAASRMLTYLSLAQHQAVLAAEAGPSGPGRPSVRAAVGGASVAVLSAFFPLDALAIEALLAADLNVPPGSGTKQEDAVAGEAIGRGVGADIVAQSATDNYLVLSPGLPPVGPGYWVSSGASIVRSLYGTRPFFLTSVDQLRSPPPPAFGSAEFLAALKNVRAISDHRTAEHLTIAQFWNTATPPFTAGAHNLIADNVITARRANERDAARILAYANAAAFDAQIACFDAKFAYWFIRPSQADPAITLPIGLPNHPSYPSAHSCITSAIMTVLAAAFPDERRRLEGIVEAAGLSRIYGGIHYRFDIDAGQVIGRSAAALALAGRLEPTRQ